MRVYTFCLVVKTHRKVCSAPANDIFFATWDFKVSGLVICTIFSFANTLRWFMFYVAPRHACLHRVRFLMQVRNYYQRESEYSRDLADSLHFSWKLAEHSHTMTPKLSSPKRQMFSHRNQFWFQNKVKRWPCMHIDCKMNIWKATSRILFLFQVCRLKPKSKHLQFTSHSTASLFFKPGR